MTVDESFVVSTYVVPFYMSRLDPAEVRQLAALARAASVDEILWMIDNAGWREQRVGASFALVRTEPAIGPALLAAIPRTHGTYGLHSLVTAAVLLCAADAIPVLHTHQQRVNAIDYRGDPVLASSPPRSNTSVPIRSTQPPTTIAPNSSGCCS